MRDLNTVKKPNPIGKLVYFDNKETAQRFVDLYKDLFFIPKNGSRSKDGYLLNRTCTYFKERSYYVYFTIFKSDWEKIVTDLKLERVNKVSPRGYYFKN